MRSQHILQRLYDYTIDDCRKVETIATTYPEVYIDFWFQALDYIIFHQSSPEKLSRNFFSHELSSSASGTYSE